MALEKFNWQNGTQIEPAKVEIGGQSYNVTDAQFEGETPLSSSNLNLMQDTLLGNVKDNLNDDTKIPSVKAINDLNTYFTTEQRVGTWIDGKPLYRITLATTSPSQVDNWKVLYSGNVKAIISYGGYMVGSTTTNWAFPLNTTNDNFWFTTQNGGIRMATNASGYLNKNIYVWFEYTKTTD